jgi:hypothetical protein
MDTIRAPTNETNVCPISTVREPAEEGLTDRCNVLLYRHDSGMGTYVRAYFSP